MHVVNIFHMYPQAMYGVEMKAVEINLHHQTVLSVGRTHHTILVHQYVPVILDLINMRSTV